MPNKHTKILNQRTIAAILREHRQKIRMKGGILYGLESTPMKTASQTEVINQEQKLTLEKSPPSNNHLAAANEQAISSIGCFPFCSLFRRATTQTSTRKTTEEKNIAVMTPS